MRLLFLLVLLIPASRSLSQHPDSFINRREAERIIGVLASDSLKGRGNFSKELEQAALFIADEFKSAGLETFHPYTSYLQPFLYLDKIEPLERVVINGEWLQTKEYLFISPYRFPPTVHLNQFEQKKFSDGVSASDISDSLALWKDIGKPLLLLLPSGQNLLKNISPDSLYADMRLIIERPDSLEEATVFFKPELRKKMLFNVIGFLPGKSKPGELVLVTAHYDHVGVDDRKKSDSIFNGANDNASGTASMIMLAKYFAAKKDNERSIMFVAFAGEEIGLVGSINLSLGLDADSMVAVINLEMLGKPGRGDRRSCIVTGSGDIPKLFKKEAKKKAIRIEDDNFHNQNLFARSDNYPFARRGVPAHTFMNFIEGDPDYHQPSDEIETLDLENMAEIVKGLIGGIEKLASGKFTPKRMKL